MVGRRILGAVSLGAVLIATASCGRENTPTSASAGAGSSPEAQLPFERAAQKTGVSPTSSVIPPGANLPVGTSLTVHLKSVISSASDRTGDRFLALLDEPIIVNGETIAPAGGVAIGRILEARKAGRSNSPGYLRLVLTSIPVRGKSVLIQTSSNFVKGARPRNLTLAQAGHAGDGLVMAAEAASGNSATLGTVTADRRLTGVTAAKDALVGPEHPLTFRLTEPLPLPERD
jgi:hypothetical protein